MAVHHPSIIPPFVYPACEYARRVETVLSAADLDIKDPDNIKKFCPIIVSKLPVGLLKLLPKPLTIRNLLDLLLSIDKPKPSTANLFTQAQVTVSNRPSLLFLHYKDKARESMPPGTADDAISALAWSAMKNSLSINLKVYVPMLNVVHAPTEDQLRQLDDAFEQYQPAEPSLIHAISENLIPNSTAPDNVSSRLDSIEESLRSLSQSIQPTNNNNNIINRREQTTQRTNTNNRNSQITVGNNSPFRSRFPGRTYNNTRNQSNAVANNNKHVTNYSPQNRYLDAPARFGQNQTSSRAWNQPQIATRARGYCDYHRRFGDKARNCVPPCTFARPLN